LSRNVPVKIVPSLIGKKHFGAGRGLRHEGAMQEGEERRENERRERVIGKAAEGECVFVTW